MFNGLLSIVCQRKSFRCYSQIKHTSSPSKTHSKYGANTTKINHFLPISVENRKKKMECNLFGYTPFIWI